MRARDGVGVGAGITADEVAVKIWYNLYPNAYEIFEDFVFKFYACFHLETCDD